ncbi:DUF7219 family protein [Vacuolonema iberomarrocanum]|uniref:DUF7219 family protein n=1 Tax=Vacuolonema iberomarrocanum TaxID=3454632 RepID=UPI0019E67337|nr:hypothetical protein [filamentous cyanobacterium LEGE 07170]
MSDNTHKEVDPGKDRLLYPIGRYRGKFKVGNVAFNANLQEFAQKIGYICNLETGGKISSEDAYDQIKDLWKNLKKSKKALLDTPEPPTPELPE